MLVRALHVHPPWESLDLVLALLSHVAHIRQAGALPVFRSGIYFSSKQVFFRLGLHRISFKEHFLDIQLTRYVSYVPNGFSQVKVLQARANTIFRQDKVIYLLEIVRSTIKPIDQSLELVLQRDTEIETKIAQLFSL